MKSKRNAHGLLTLGADGQTVGGVADWLLSGLGDDAAEAAWCSSLALLERAAERAREGRHGRWAHYPPGELRRLRRDVAQALWLARTACTLQDRSNDLAFDLTRAARESGQRAGATRRRAQTMEAERVRLLRARCRREGREPTAEELRPWLLAGERSDGASGELAQPSAGRE